MVLRLDGTYLIKSVDEPLSSLTPEAPCSGHTGRGMHEGVNDRDKLGGRDLCRMSVIVDCGWIGSFQEGDDPRQNIDCGHRSKSGK